MDRKKANLRRGGKKSGPRFWAWTASIAVHLIVLSAFGVVKFSQLEVKGQQRRVPVASVNQVKKLIDSTPIIPKPRIKRPAKTFAAPGTDEIMHTDRIFEITKPVSDDLPEFAKPSASQDTLSLAGSTDLIGGVEFFGSRTDERKLCYVVDCSGSMQGLFGQVREELSKSIAGLRQDQYFYVIFFGAGKLFEFGDGRLIRATGQAKSAAYDFIDSIRPTGRTNAMAALQKAIKIRDGRGQKPSIIYFLTDGFELTTEDVPRFSQKIANLLERFAPTTKINTIGFWPQEDDRKMLQTIAELSGGEFVFVTGEDG